MKILSLFSKNKEAKNASWIIAEKIIQMILSFFVGLYTARFLGPGNYGLINYVGAYIAFFTCFCTLGINSVIIKRFSDKPGEEGDAIGTSITLRLISSILSALMVVGLVCMIDAGETDTCIVALICSLALPFQAVDTLNSWFQYKYQSKYVSIATLIGYVVTAAYKIVLLILKKSVFWFAAATAVDYIVLAIFTYWAYKTHGGPKLTFTKKTAKELLGSSYHYILSGMMVAIYGQTDKLMLKQMLSEVEVGYYSCASYLCGIWVFVLSAIIQSIVPTIIRLNEEDEAAFNRKNKQLYAIIFYLSAFVSLFYTVFAEFGIRLTYGVEFLNAANPLRIVTWYTAFAYLGVARDSWVVCKNNQKYLKYMYLSAAVINVILNFIAIPIWGPSGAALASLVTQICTSIVLPLFIKDMRPNALLMLDAILLRDVLPTKKNIMFHK